MKITRCALFHKKFWIKAQRPAWRIVDTQTQQVVKESENKKTEIFWLCSKCHCEHAKK